MKERLFRKLRRVFVTGISLILFVVPGAGCHSLQAAARLGSRGQIVGHDLAASMDGLSTALTLYVEGEYLHIVLEETSAQNMTEGQRIQAREDALEAIERTSSYVEDIQLRLTARRAVFRKLSQMYSAFKELSDYDAAGEFETAVDGLFTAVKGYHDAVGSTNLDPRVTTIIAPVVGWLTRGAQAKKIVLASEQIRTTLGTTIALMEVELDDYNDMLEASALANAKVAKKLFERGIGRPHPILRSHLGSFGIEYNDSDYTQLPPLDKEIVQRAVFLVVDLRMKRQIALSKNLFASQLDALRELVILHKSVEKKSWPDMTQLVAYLIEIRTTVDKLNEIRAQRDESQSKDQSRMRRIMEFIETIRPLLPIPAGS